MTTTEDQVATNTTDIATNRTATTAVNNRVNGHETRITALENTVAGVDDRLQSMDQRVTRAEQTAQTAIEGVAVALSLADPVLTGGDSFGIRVNWGHFDGHSAIGLSMMGVLDRNLFGGGETLAIGGGIGVGLADGATGGRIGLQLSWK